MYNFLILTEWNWVSDFTYQWYWYISYYLSQWPEIQHMEVCELSCSLCIDTTHSCCYMGADVLMAFTIKRYQVVENHQDLSSVWVSNDGILYIKIFKIEKYWFQICYHFPSNYFILTWTIRRLYFKKGYIFYLFLKYRSILLLLSILVDRIFYGDWVLVQYNFLEFNVLHGGSAFYGSHPWHWYITQGYPVIMATHLIPFTFGGWYAKNKVLLMLIIWNIFIFR